MPDENTIFEITSRTLQSRYLLKPSQEVKETILGVIGKAQQMYPEISIYCFVFLSNHFQMLASAPDFGAISDFLGYIKSNIARELGRVYEWREKFWGRRFRAISVLDEPALVGRVRYILEHGCKEDLVFRPEDWPGVQCVGALTRGEPLVGYWLDRTGLYNASRSGKEVDTSDFVEEVEVQLTPLPILEDLTEEQRREWYVRMVAEIEKETRERHEADGTRPLGVKAILAQDPLDSPKLSKRSPAPACHAASRSVRKWFRRAYRRFVSAYLEASRQSRSGHLTTEFPVRCFRPPLPYGLACT